MVAVIVQKGVFMNDRILQAKWKLSVYANLLALIIVTVAAIVATYILVG